MILLNISAPICVTAGTHISQRVVVVIGGLVGGIGLCFSCFLVSIEYVIIVFGVFYGKPFFVIFEPRHGKTGFLHMQKQRRRSASR